MADVPEPIKTSHKLRRQARRRDEIHENRNPSKQDVVRNERLKSRDGYEDRDTENV